MPAPGKRNDLLEAKEAIDAGASLKDLWRDHYVTMVRYSRAMQEYINVTRVNPRHSADVSKKVKVVVFWGPPGTGKSTEALALGGPDAFWVAPGNGTGAVWWDGYDNQETVIIDEFYDWIPKNTLQRILQMKPFQVQTKGGSRQLAATTFIITSNSHPKDWYKNSQHMEALLRRIDDIRHLTVIKDPYLLQQEAEINAGYPLWVREDLHPQVREGPLGDAIEEPLVCEYCGIRDHLEMLYNGRCVDCWDIEMGCDGPPKKRPRFTTAELDHAGCTVASPSFTTN